MEREIHLIKTWIVAIILAFVLGFGLCILLLPLLFADIFNTYGYYEILRFLTGLAMIQLSLFFIFVVYTFRK